MVRHDASNLHVDAKLQAGDVLGEMAVITGRSTRNASVVARTPVTLCVFSEETFRSFITAEGFQDRLLLGWSMRPIIAKQAQFNGLIFTVLEKLSQIGELVTLPEGGCFELTEACWCLLSSGDATLNAESMYQDEDYGARPFAAARTGPIISKDDCVLLLFDARRLERLRLRTPQLNYKLRKLRMQTSTANVSWKLGKVDIFD